MGDHVICTATRHSAGAPMVGVVISVNTIYMVRVLGRRPHLQDLAHPIHVTMAAAVSLLISSMIGELITAYVLKDSLVLIAHRHLTITMVCPDLEQSNLICSYPY